MSAHRSENFRALLDALATSPTSRVHGSGAAAAHQRFADDYRGATHWYRTQVDRMLDALDQASDGDFSTKSPSARLAALRAARMDRRSTAYWNNSLGAAIDTAIALASTPFFGEDEHWFGCDIPI